ncbi:AP2-like ethylene-responsive transcription factor AIL5 [Prunus yedoensis var. nudiflora]|uniref:AP2-like ethylene-responsive transcription factor AIL5 n=1 Tax=Prunus yedoensis var. nudiflora TaxID=2094558 RepID=A0A314YR74_PRUYE|nr:AP2-like ethylene-responsive transcription factor AIL5 [Prunus yedoensis var. nudiflora]
MDSSPQNWLLGFSLSNHSHHRHPSHDLSLFEAFTSSPSHTSAHQQQDHSNPGGATPSSPTDLSIFSSGVGGPKLEDFLGGSTATPPSLAHFSGTTAAADQPHNHQQTAPLALSENEIYDSELKTIAASFLRGFSTPTTAAATSVQTTKPQKPGPSRLIRTHPQKNGRHLRPTHLHLPRRTGGQEDMKRICGITVAEEKDKVGKADKVSSYEKELNEMKNMTRQEFVASLRRKSSGFSRGASIYRGVTRHHQHGRWQARIGRVAGNKDLYLGTFSTQEEAAEAYDIAAIKFRGLNAVTNFDMSRYDVKSIANSNLPIGGMSGKSKNSSDSDSKSIEGNRSADDRDLSSASSVTFASQQTSSSTLSFAIPIKQDPSTDYWSNIFGYHHNAKNPSTVSVAPSSLFQSCTTNVPYGNNSSQIPFNMDFSVSATSSTSPSETNNGYFVNYNNAHGQQKQQQDQSTSGTNSIPFATPIALNSNNGFETSSGYGSWIGPSLHTFQTHAKTNLFQTPIFGME